MSHATRANEVVALGNPLPVHLGQDINNNNTTPSFSQAPTLAPSSSSRSSNEEKPHSGGAAVIGSSSSGYTTSHDPEKGGLGHNGYAGDDHEGLDEHHVDVAKAKEEFHALQRRMSERSSLHRARTRGSSAPGDVEKQEDEEWNLMDYMKGNQAVREQEGFRHKEVGVVWDHLRVIGGGGMKIHIRTFPNAIIEQFVMPVLKVLKVFGIDPMSPKSKDLLTDFSGLLRPGEMCLVLARPGGGASTFLKAITNNRESYQKVEGDVVYQGLSAKEMKKRYAGEVLYSEEDDDHLPTLTVRQTIETALRCKTPGKLPSGVSDKEFREEFLNTLLKMLNIEHTAGTLVGNQFIRGVSGGERKRVSIAEAFCGQGCVFSWDNSTRGLDASTALDYAKSIRTLTDISKMTSFVSLYQAGEGIYEQFDKVLLIDKGQQIYYGPANRAREHMLSLGWKDKPRQTTADFLTGCTDENEREYAEGHDENNTPTTPEAQAKAYLESPMFREMQAEALAYKQEMERDNSRQEEFRNAVSESKRKFVGKKSPYTVSFFTQVKSLVQRQLILNVQDKLTLYSGFFTAIAIAFIAGSCFYDLPQTASGAFTRGGVLFIAMLFNSLNAFSELPGQMQGRPILYAQANKKFYRPGALSVAQTIADFPLNAFKILLFTIIIYFLAGLARSAGAFFTNYLFVLVTYLVMSAFFRVLGTATRDYNVAARLASVLISFMVIYAGYMIPVFTMKRWLFWIYYINPLSYGFESLMVNEFMRVNLECDAGYIVPYGAGFPATVTNTQQTCTLAGSTPGQNAVPGVDYVSAAYDYARGHLWRNLGILIGFFIFFAFLQIVAMEYLAMSAANVQAIVVFAKENKDTKERNERLIERKKAFQAGEMEQDLAGLIESKRALTWSGLNYTVKVPGGERQLLNEVDGYCKPGQLTALMGASGAGKTTLLDVLASRKTLGVIGGDVLIGGKEKDVSFQKGTAYVEQGDVHEWTTTVREAMRFSAYLRQPAEVSKAEKDDYVEEILELLELQELADAMIGFPGFGLSVESRKRLTIGVELASKPQLMLFLDEPTTGLDGQSAYNIVRFLRKLAAAGQAILCTIHQPNAVLFENFDRLLLLQKGGQCVYHGPIGKGSEHLLAYLEKGGAKIAENENPAEAMLDVIGAGSRKRVGDEDWGVKWNRSEERATVLREIKELNEEAIARNEEIPENLRKEYSTSFFFQLKTVLHRTNVSLWRNADYQYTRLFSHIIIALVTALTFLQLGNEARELQYRVFAIFIVTILPALVIAQIEPQFVMSRMTYYREASSKMYSSQVFAITQIVAELPYSLLCAVAFFLVWYYPIYKSQYESYRAGYQFAMILITELFSVTLGQAVAALSPSIFVAALFNPFLLVIFSLFCGVTIPYPNLTYFWRQWLYWLNPFTWLVAGLTATALHDLPVVCGDDEYFSFTTPAGQTCAEYAGQFAQSMGAYISNPQATGECQYCQYSSGNTFLESINSKYSERGRNIGIYCCYLVSNVFIILVASRFLKYTKR